jgi:hypothetical protein
VEIRGNAMMEAMKEKLFILMGCEHGQSRTLNTAGFPLSRE